MSSIQSLDVLRQLDIARVEKATLVEIASVHIDTAVSIGERARQYLLQVKNPYAFRAGDVAVKVEFAQSGRTLREAVESYLLTIR